MLSTVALVFASLSTENKTVCAHKCACREFVFCLLMPERKIKKKVAMGLP
jgi:hypothetical protein